MVHVNEEPDVAPADPMPVLVTEFLQRGGLAWLKMSYRLGVNPLPGLRKILPFTIAYRQTGRFIDGQDWLDECTIEFNDGVVSVIHHCLDREEVL